MNDRQIDNYLAKCYLEGLGTSVDEDLAILCLERCVEEKGCGFEEARIKLIEYYEKGKGSGDVSEKLQKLKEERKKNDDLVNGLLNIL